MFRLTVLKTRSNRANLAIHKEDILFNIHSSYNHLYFRLKGVKTGPCTPKYVGLWSDEQFSFRKHMKKAAEKTDRKAVARNIGNLKKTVVVLLYGALSGQTTSTYHSNML